jgi:hypothetical protein
VYQHHLGGMLKALLPVLKSQRKAEIILERYWRNRIALVWEIQDVHRAANEKSTALTNKEAREILQDFHEHHNAQYGLQWEDLYESIKSHGFGRKLTKAELDRFINTMKVTINK